MLLFRWAAVMLPRKAMLCVVLVNGVLGGQAVWAHSGGVDKQGGHTSRYDNSYHCHRETCQVEARQRNKIDDTAKRYRRRDWPHWSDLDADCQDSRVELLIASSAVTVAFQDTDPCEEVTSGHWFDPYTGRVFQAAALLDIDHRVALKEAHKLGGAHWSRQKKQIFANDPENLIAVYRGANRAKGSKSSDQWLPSVESYRCEYIEKRLHIMRKYDLIMPKTEAGLQQQYCF